MYGEGVKGVSGFPGFFAFPGQAVFIRYYEHF
jgi:hypothetical protein